MADGAASSENPMMLGSRDVTPNNFFGGSDGIAWDDRRISVPLIRVPVALRNSIGLSASGGDCLAWPYAALAFG
jgi:hypothetical protein